jgi:hypothetical protein
MNYLNKIYLVLPLSYFVLTEKQALSILILIVLIFIDTFLGMWIRLKIKQFSSWGLKRVMNKICLYTVGLFGFFVFSKEQSLGINLDFVFSFLIIFINLVELTSIAEKLALLGFRTPLTIVGILNEKFENGKIIKDKKELRKFLDEIDDLKK